MFGRHWARLRAGRSLMRVSLALVLAAWAVTSASAQQAPVVVQVEEDWELVVRDPDAGITAPQVTTTISPYNHLNNLHATFELNHKTVPSFAPGGCHLQTWAGEYNLTRKSMENSSRLSTPGETVRWTTRMRLSDHVLVFSIVNGTSTTWGEFGGGSYLFAGYGTSLDTLAGYSPDFSVENSGIGFAANRVESLVLKRVRYTLADGTVVTDNNARVVHALED